jgi:hypothetical protein
MPTNTRAHLESEEVLYEVLTDSTIELEEDLRWGEVWTIPNKTAGYGDAKFYWDFPLPDGSYFADPQWEVLYRSIQLCVDLMFKQHGKQRAKSAGSAGVLISGLRFFVRWMTIFGYKDLSCLDTFRFEEFYQWVEITKCRGVSEQGEGQKSITVLHARALLSFPAALFYYNDALQRAGLPNIPVRPYEGRNVMELANEICDKQNGSFQAVPDGLFVPVVNKVIQWLDCQVDEIQAAVDVYRQRFAVDASGVTQAKHRKKALARLSFSLDADTNVPWFSGFESRVTRKRLYAHSPERRGLEVELNTGHVIKDLVNAARDCCTIALQATVGMRISEVCGLQVTGKKKRGDWPSCVEVKRSLSGMDELFFITGTVFKDKERPRPGRWLAGSRPLGTTEVPIAIKAIMKLERLYAPWRQMSGKTDLILAFSNRVGLAVRPESVAAPISSTIREGQKEWVKHYGNTPAEYDTWELTTHQWRKAFARFCVRVDSTLLPAVSRHFHHTSIQITEQHYAGEDSEIRYLIREAALELAADFLYQATHSEGHAAGGLMDEIPDVAEQLSHHVDMDDEDESRGFIYATMNTDDTWGWDMTWGGCLFRPEHAQCHLRTAFKKIIPIAPALDGLSPFSSCSKCKNHIVLPRHLPFWNARRTSLLAQRKENKQQGLTDVDFILGHRLAQCNHVISRIRRGTPS